MAYYNYGIYVYVCFQKPQCTYLLYFVWTDQRVQQFYNSRKATNYELLVSRPGETIESMRVGGYYYYYLEYCYLECYHCTTQH